jgi:uncharacterized membrane protein
MSRTRYIAQAGVIAAVYGGLTLLMLAYGSVFAWGPVQFRLSEAATVLAFFTPAAIPGLTIGSVVANLLNPQAVWPISLFDVFFGSLGTLLGAYWTWRFRGIAWLGLLGPVVTNALIVPAYLPAMLRGFGMSTVPLLGLSLTGSWPVLYAIFAASIAVGQAVVVYGLGWPLLAALRRLGLQDLVGGQAGRAERGADLRGQ